MSIPSGYVAGAILGTMAVVEYVDYLRLNLKGKSLRGKIVEAVYGVPCAILETATFVYLGLPLLAVFGGSWLYRRYGPSR